MSIKITVAYTAPITDKFDALMTQYGEVKRLSNETVNFYRPLAEAAEETKLALILEQLETIHGYLLKLNSINDSINFIKAHSQPGHKDSLEFLVELGYNNEMVVNWDRLKLNHENVVKRVNYFTANYHDRYNILGNWDNWGMYERLENRCIELLNLEINKQKKLAEDEKNRFHNIVGV